MKNKNFLTIKMIFLLSTIWSISFAQVDHNNAPEENRAMAYTTDDSISNVNSRIKSAYNSMEDSSKNTFQDIIAPPFSIKDANNLHLNYTEIKEILVTVIDIYGNEFFSKIKLSDNNQIVFYDILNRLNAGMYLVTGTNNVSLHNKKIVIQEENSSNHFDIFTKNQK